MLLELFKNPYIRISFDKDLFYILAEYENVEIDFESAKNICAERLKAIEKTKCNDMIVIVNKGTFITAEAMKIFSSKSGIEGVNFIAVVTYKNFGWLVAFILNLISPKTKQVGKPLTKIFTNYKKAEKWLMKTKLKSV